MGIDRWAERAEQEREEQALRDARRDRVADHTPAPEEWRGGEYALGPVTIATCRTASDWRASASARWDRWESGQTEMEAIGKMVVTLAAEKALPGGLTIEDFETPLTDEERRKIEAMAGVLERHRGTLLRLLSAVSGPEPVEIVRYGTREQLLRDLLAAAESPF